MDRTHLDADTTSPPHRWTTPLPAVELGGCRLLRLLGTGGMSSVYLGEGADGSLVAVKVLSPLLARQELLVSRFDREARHGMELRHANLVRGLAAGRDPATGLHFLVLEYLEGGTAQALLDRRGPFSPDDVVSVGLATARALEYLHGRGIIHRDIKPDNLFLTRDGLVKLGDLGLAKQLDDPTPALTLMRQVFGTTHYMPYEQAVNARLADQRSDIYALGATLYHLVTGVVPFPGEDHATVVRQKREGRFLSPRQRVPGIPPALDAVLCRMLALDPRERYPSATAVRQALEATGLEATLPSYAQAISQDTGELPTTEPLAPTRPELDPPGDPWWQSAPPLALRAHSLAPVQQRPSPWPFSWITVGLLVLGAVIACVVA